VGSDVVGGDVVCWRSLLLKPGSELNQTMFSSSFVWVNVGPLDIDICNPNVAYVMLLLQ